MDRLLLHGEAQLPGPEQHLEVKGEAVGGALGKDGPGGGAAVALDAALGVVGQAGEEPHQKAKDLGGQQPDGGITLIAQLVQPPGADAQVCPRRQLVQHGGDILQPVGQVGVGAEHIVPSGLQHTRPDGLALAAVGVVAGEADMAVLKGPHQVGHVVGAAVVHDEQLVVRVHLRQPGRDGAEGGLNDAALIIGGDDQGKLHAPAPPSSSHTITE